MITFQNLTAALDSTGACLFTTFGIGADELAELLTALTGVDYTTEDFMKVGDRIWNLERMWNLKPGSRPDDFLPDRLLKTRQDRPVQRRGQPDGSDAARVLRTARLGRERRPGKAKLKELRSELTGRRAGAGELRKRLSPAPAHPPSEHPR